MIKFASDFETYRPDGIVRKAYRKGEEAEFPPADEAALIKKGVTEKGGGSKAKKGAKDEVPAEDEE